MDVLWNDLGIGCICLSIWMIIVSLYTILKERKLIRHRLAPGEKVPPWYTNATLRKYSELLFNGMLLILFITNLMRFQKHDASASLWVSLSLFLSGCYRLAFTLFEDAGYRVVARQTGKDILGWPRSSHFHEGIAAAIFWLGMSLATLLNGLVAIKVQTYEATNGLAWFAAGLVFVSGLYWLGVYAFREVKKYRVRASSSSQTPD